MYSFTYLEWVCRSMSSCSYCFLICIHVSQEAGQVIWYALLFQNFPQFIVIHTVKDFGIVNKAEKDVFLELSCFFDDPSNVGVLPVVRVPGQERRILETMQLTIGEFITDSSQGLLPSPRMWGRKALSPSSLGYLLGTIISWRKWIGYTVARQFLLV